MSDLVVTVKQGDLRGVEVENVVGGSYFSFSGIPYAAPPVGDLRFRDPQAPQAWVGIRDASKEGSVCPQFDMFSKEFVGDDDCLYLNVATTSLTESRPVMVWIHGGAFLLGDGGCGFHGPDYFMGSGIVYVGINYRFGVLGFLNLDHEVAPGNAGLKDQVAALRWVKENIAQFGGDPNNVTIFGESAGGASVHYLLLSPLAKGLFHKAITQSGVALNSWAHVPDTLATARRIVAALGRNISDPEEIVEYLRTIPAHRLIEVQESLFSPGGKTLFLPFVPSTDTKSIEPFMPGPPEQFLAESSNVPVIIGYTSHEGIVFLNESILQLGREDEADNDLVEYFEAVVPRALAAKAPSKVPEIARVIRKLYFGDKRITKDLIEEYVQIWGDLYFGLGVHRVVESMREKKSPTYFYKFSHDSPHSGFKKIFPNTIKGAMHGAEIEYLFTASRFRGLIPDINGDPTEVNVRNRFIRMWTNFAKTGNPTPSTDDLITAKWEPLTRTAKNYLEINAELSCGVNPDPDVWDTWKHIYALVDDQ